MNDSRELPSNLKAEQALLGAILSNNRAFDLCPGLEPEHFGYEVNAEIFRAIKLRIIRGRSVDAVTLWPALQFTGLLNDVGGVAYLTSLLTAMVGISNAGDYAREIRDCASRRAQIEAGRELIEKAYRSKLEDGDASATAAWGISAIEDAARLAGGAEKQSMATAVRQAMEQSERAQAGDKSAMGLYTGIITLDNMWGGLYPGSLEIIGARPRTGKTSIALQIARKVAGELVAQKRKGCVLISSLEVSAQDIGRANLASLSGVSAAMIRRGEITTAQAHAMLLAERQLAKLPIEIIDQARMPLGEMVGEARTLKRTRNLTLWIIDHRGLIGRDPGWEKASMLDWLRETTQRLKAVSKQLSVPILLLVQISRGIESRDDPRPRLSDLEYGGEADADSVILMYRPELYGNAPERKANETAEAHGNRLSIWHQERRLKAGLVEYIFAKQRFGAGGICTLKFTGATTTFGEVPVNNEPD